MKLMAIDVIYPKQSTFLDLHSTSEPIEMVEVDEMHSYIGSKKTIVGFGLLLIDMEKDLSTSLLATEVTKQQQSFGKK